jgi:hypothetical protein
VRTVLVVAAVLGAGCSALVSFDRSRIGDGGGPDAGDAGPSMCTVESNAGCGDDQLCCPGVAGAECIATSNTQCSACGAGCLPDTTNDCVDRACVCGTSEPCSGSTPFCDDAEGECVQCRSDDDCDVDAPQCVEGTCAACDPEDNSGCSGGTPICDTTTLGCVGCDATHLCPDPLVCQGDGTCGCMNDEQCEGNPTTPICDAMDDICVGCADDNDCSSRSLGAMCLDDGSCAECDPATNMPCTGNEPICRRTAGRAACEPCAMGECAGVAGMTACALTGPNMGECVECIDDTTCGTDSCDTTTNTCVECTQNSDCGDTTTPICMGGSCVPCENDGQCEGAFCVTSGVNDGACRTCDPTDNGGCVTAGMPFCSADGSACGGCTSNAQCGGMFCITSGAMMGACGACDPMDNEGCTDPRNPICNAAGSMCGPCTSNTQCGAMFCATSGDRSGACSACDPMDNEGCTGGQTCNAMTATCGTPSPCGVCSGATPICVGTTCRACNPAGNVGCMGASVCNPFSFTCVDCNTAIAASTECGAVGDGTYDCNNSNECICENPAGCTCDDDSTPGGGVSCARNNRCDRSTGTCI